MLYIQKIIAAAILPPGIFILALLLLSLYMFSHRSKGRYLAALLTVILYLCSTNLVAGLLMRPLERTKPADVTRADVILVLGGGAVSKGDSLNPDGSLGGFSANRLLTAAQLQHKLRVPILITGGQAFAQSGNEARICRSVLKNLGVDDKMIITEEQAKNTAENAIKALEICRQYGFKKIALVTSAFHMRRSMVNFTLADNEQLFILLPYPCDYQCGNQPAVDLFIFVPQQDALNMSYLALHEYLGLAAKQIL